MLSGEIGDVGDARVEVGLGGECLGMVFCCLLVEDGGGGGCRYEGRRCHAMILVGGSDGQFLRIRVVEMNTVCECVYSQTV